MGRFALRRSVFRQDGRPHQLLVLTDLSRALREEEREAWQRLVRVLGHELNNSLAPIKSLAGSLERLLAREPLPEDWRDDSLRGLGVIAQRADALTRFLDAYAKLARLPPPRRQATDLGALIRRVATLERRVVVAVESGELLVSIDADQVEQLLINLILQRGGRRALRGQSTGGNVGSRGALLEPGPQEVEVLVTDAGPGLANSANLFVPFLPPSPRAVASD